MGKTAVIIGNSDGIGLRLTRELLTKDWNVTGISRSPSPVEDPSYVHHAEKVQNSTYTGLLRSVVEASGQVDLCVYCTGIGELLDLSDMGRDVEIVDVNFLGMIKTATMVIPHMVSNGSGHFIGLSSLADVLLSKEAPSYHASKAGFSNYLEGLALAVKDRGVYVTNLRFGFVDTKMAKSDRKPFMMTVERAVRHIFRCMEKRPIRYTAPRIVIPMVKLLGWTQTLRI